jgi:large subunit ribosomal protein L15
VNIGKLEGRFEAGTTVDLALLKEQGVVARAGKNGLKVLGGGDLTVALNIKAAEFSKTASEKIAAAGGTAETV